MICRVYLCSFFLAFGLSVHRAEAQTGLAPAQTEAISPSRVETTGPALAPGTPATTPPTAPEMESSVDLDAPAVPEDLPTDPFKAVEYLQLANGMQVFLAPSKEASLTEVRLEVGVGYEVEDSTNWSISHLLEHVLFRDKQLKDEMSYLQLIKEAGGEANGTTEARRTSYFGSVPAAKAGWLLDTFGKMLLNPSITEEYVEKEKGTVELERGRPGPLTQLLGFNPMDYWHPRYLKVPSFWKSEFDISLEDKFTLSQEQLSTQKLRASQLKEFYKDYYHPANMRLFIAGKFDRTRIMKQIEAQWAKLPARPGKVMPPIPLPNPRLKPYARSQVYESTPYVYIGTKVWDTTLKDREILDSYVEYLAHRLMKEVRNRKGQTYTARGTTNIFQRFGYTFVEFQTPKEKLEENLKVVHGYLDDQAYQGAMTPAEVQEAVGLYLDQYRLMGKEAESMMGLAQEYERILREYGQFESPYEALRSVSVEDYNTALKKYFSPNRRYEYLYRPPYLFAYDYFVLYAAVAILCFLGLRAALTKPFANDRLRWVRKVKYPPLMALEALTLIAAWYAFTHVQFIFDVALAKFSILQSHMLISQYGYAVVSVISLLAIAQGFLSILPRKLMVMDDFLVIKSVTYFSRKIPLHDIATVEVARCITYPFPTARWLHAVGFRFFYFNPLFWQPGLLIHLKDGRAFYFSVTSPNKVRRELMHLVATTPPVKHSPRAA